MDALYKYAAARASRLNLSTKTQAAAKNIQKRTRVNREARLQNQVSQDTFKNVPVNNYGNHFPATFLGNKSDALQAQLSQLPGLNIATRELLY